MPWTVDFAEVAGRQYRDLPDKTRNTLARKMQALADNPLPAGCKKLRDNVYRVRAGDYRLVYEVYWPEQRILVTRVRHRRDVYRGL